MEEKNNQIPENQEKLKNLETQEEKSLSENQEVSSSIEEIQTSQENVSVLKKEDVKKEVAMPPEEERESLEKESPEDSDLLENPLDQGEPPVETFNSEDSIAKDFEQVAELESKMMIITDEEEDEHEEVEASEEDEDFSLFSLEDLIEKFKSVLEEEDFNSYKKKVAQIKVTFHKKMSAMKLLLSDKEEETKTEDLKVEAVEGSKEETKVEEKKEEAQTEPKEEKFEIKSELRDLQNKFNGYFQIYKEKKKAFFEDLEKIKEENLSKKNSILAEMKDLLDSEASLKEIDDNFNKLKTAFREIGMVPKESLNNLWRTYHFYQERFFDKIKINRELRDLGLAKNLEKKMKLCEQTEELLLETSPQKAFKSLQEYHTKWKEIGAVPQEKREELWERFKAATEKIHDIRHQYYEQFKEREEEFYKKKLILCDRIEEDLKKELKSFKDWNKQTENIKNIFEEWKSLGRAPKEVNDEVWKRFKTSMDSFYQMKREHFNKAKEEQKDNLNFKIELCAKAESLQDSKDWKNTTKELIELQKKWKESGPVPRKYADKVWKRFRSACDIFFKNKSEHFSNAGEEQKENLEKKKAIISVLQSFEIGENPKENLDKLQAIQREWSSIGFVPFKVKERIYQLYREALNELYDKLNISRKEIENQNFKERFEQLSDDPKGKQSIQKERRFLVNKLREKEDEINLWENNLGFFSHGAGAQKMKEEYQKKIDKARRDLDGLREKIRILGDM